jgi:hypothetical protein
MSAGPTIAEIAEMTRELQRLTRLGRDADPAELAAYQARKREVLARIEEANR